MIKCRLPRNKERNCCSTVKSRVIWLKKSIKWIKKYHRLRKKKGYKDFKLRNWESNLKSTIKLGKRTNRSKTCKSRWRKWRLRMIYLMNWSRASKYRYQLKLRDNSSNNPRAIILFSIINQPSIYQTLMQLNTLKIFWMKIKAE